MDNQKTGALIAARRTELGLTQKQLAEQLHISDRTVSKWERGAGFPDISLLEPVADALGLSVLELLRGERLEKPQQETEETIREATRGFSIRFKTTIKRFRWALTVLVSLLIVITAAIWIFGGLQTVNHSAEISPSEALLICPFSLISTEEYEFLQLLLQDEDITGYFTKTAEENYRTTADDCKKIEEDILSRYQGILSIDGEPAVISDSLITKYGLITIGFQTDNKRCYLQYYNGSISKSCSEYDEEFGSIYVISNDNNQAFSIMTKSPRIVAALSK